MFSTKGGGLFDGDGRNQGAGGIPKPLREIIDSYFETYMIANVTRLLSAINTDKEVTRSILINLSKLDAGQLEEILRHHYGDEHQNFEIKSIYRVLNRHLTGNATEGDVLIKSILAMRLNISLDKIFTQVASQLKIKWDECVRETHELRDISFDQSSVGVPRSAGDASLAGGSITTKPGK